MVATVVKKVGDYEMRSRHADKYVDATKLCKAAGKEWSHYRENKATDEFLRTLEGSIGIPVDRLVQTTKTGPNESRGTWIHPRVAIHFAQWVSPEFAVAVTGWVLELLSTGSVALPGAVTLTAEQFERLTGRFEHLQQQVDRLAAAPPAMLSPACPRFTLRQRLAWHGWTNCPPETRRAITKHVKNLIWQFCDDTPHQAGGEAGGGPLVFHGSQLVYVDEAILHFRACTERARLADEARQPTLPFNEARPAA